MKSVVATVMNMKGGVGKTTAAIHVGGILAAHSDDPIKVLLLDYDPQFNLSQAFIEPETYFSLEKSRKTCFSILQDDETQINPYTINVPGNLTPPPVSQLAYSLFEYNDGSCLDIVPSTLDLMYLALGVSAKRKTAFDERFEKFIRAARRKYDFILIDCHPAGSILTRTSLQNSDHVIIPVAPEQYGVRGVALMLNFIEANRHGSDLPRPHILFNRVPRTGFSHEEMKIRADRKYASICLENTLKEYSAFADPMGGDGLVWESKKPWSGQAFHNALAVAEEIENIFWEERAK